MDKLVSRALARVPLPTAYCVMLSPMAFLTQASGPSLTDTLPAHWIFDRIEEWAARSPERLAFAVDHPDKSEEYWYREVLEHAGAIAGELAAHGVKAGDRVGILM